MTWICARITELSAWARKSPVSWASFATWEAAATTEGSSTAIGTDYSLTFIMKFVTIPTGNWKRPTRSQTYQKPYPILMLFHLWMSEKHPLTPAITYIALLNVLTPSDFEKMAWLTFFLPSYRLYTSLRRGFSLMTFSSLLRLHWGRVWFL